MWWVYLLVFFGGVLFGLIIMALMAASKESEPHEVHVYSDEDGNIEVMAVPVGDKVIWHKEGEDGLRKSKSLS